MIIGVLLQGMMTPCNDIIEIEENKDGYKEDIFEPVNELGKNFYINKTHKRDLPGIMMICVHPNFRGKGLGQKLIEKHFIENQIIVFIRLKVRIIPIWYSHFNKNRANGKKHLNPKQVIQKKRTLKRK